jgi:hypothetical protein
MAVTFREREVPEERSPVTPSADAASFLRCRASRAAFRRGARWRCGGDIHRSPRPMRQLASLFGALIVLGACYHPQPGTVAARSSAGSLAGVWTGREMRNVTQFRDWKIVIAPENIRVNNRPSTLGHAEFTTDLHTRCDVDFILDYTADAMPQISLAALGARECSNYRFTFYGSLSSSSTLVGQLRDQNGQFLDISLTRRGAPDVAAAPRP